MSKYAVETLDGYSPLAPDEPTFTFRAQDRFMPDVLEYYAERCEREGASDEHIESIRKCRLITIEWQRHNEIRTPD